MAEIFGVGGLLERAHPTYEFRRGQLEMAEAVETAFREKRHLVVEAGTGTGKTLAYLIPAIRSGQRVVISTATKSLQEQLFEKDIPFLRKHFAPNLKVAVMKGRNNFLCRDKLYAVDRQGQAILKGFDELDWFKQIQQWENLTETGDRAELNFLPDSSELWQRLDARRDTCTGQKCPEFGRCFLTMMRQRAHEADIVIVNHHLFFADLALKQDDFGSILPEYHTVIFDEAHEIEDTASDYFGRKISNYRFEELARDCEHALRLKGLAAPPLLKRTTQLKEKARTFFDAFPPKEGRFPFPAAERINFSGQHGAEFDALVDATKRFESELAALPGKSEELIALARRAAELRGELQFLLDTREPNYVYWFERRGKGVFLAATPIDLSNILREQLFSQFESIVLTSATLAVASTFDFLKARLGLDAPQEKILPHEYDFQKQAMLYIPKHMPDVRDARFSESAAELITELLEISEGRAFCLFTSYFQMKEVYERVCRLVDFPLLVQGTGPRTALLDKFRATPHAVLFATATFWQGVDVPGEQLSCVIVDKLPFAVPSDPVVAARVKSLQEEGRDAFREYQVPEAVLALKQGFGRLIRSKTDRGILAILDNRIQRMGYGRTFLESLPNYAIAHDLAALKQFMNG